MRALVCFFIFAAILGVGLSRDINRALTFVGGDRPAAMAASPHDDSAQQGASSGSRTVTLDNDGRGHFRVDARVDGRRVDFLVDTGASMVVLRESDAARLSIFPRRSEYTGHAQTANGVTKYAPVRLNRIEVEGITVRDVAAAVMPDDALKVNLLGMTFLSGVKWTHDRGRLVLEQ
ncbi:MAG TPA: TIGR02281 family clan AA aspartic protease [Xanthobacteraceae bacterium]|jgi:aspartyl protease family protein|nr:TIGR02281 family clan AA aspartic protease [Xanthobacteraceae bacterium]